MDLGVVNQTAEGLIPFSTEKGPMKWGEILQDPLAVVGG